jgi:3-deoxy-D-arabino-heptulosonate 7-phosphate (DAHP) synthase
VAAGADGLYVEVHPRPEEALSDSTTQLAPERAAELLRQVLAVHAAVAEGRP